LVQQRLCLHVRGYLFSDRPSSLALPRQLGVTVNAVDPGMMPGSGLARDYPPLRRFAWRYVLPALRFLPGVNSTRMPSRVMKRPSVGAVCSTAPNALALGRLPTQSAESRPR